MFPPTFLFWFWFWFWFAAIVAKAAREEKLLEPPFRLNDDDRLL
jgi:hypothetical protein